MIKGRIGIIGAGGFIGSRLIERLLLEQSADVRAIIRGMASYPRLARFDIDIEFGDVLNLESLVKAFADCSIIFHTAVGGAQTIVKGIENTIVAASKTGVKRIVYLSSAVVHGYNPSPDTTDDSPLKQSQPFEYSNSKAEAEFIIREMRRKLPIEVVVLRPYIVYGPWATYNTTQIALRLLQRELCLVNGGKAAFNGVYVDNLIDAMLLAAVKPEAANQDFIIQDGFGMSWRDYISGLCTILGISLDGVAGLTMDEATTFVKRMGKKVSPRQTFVRLARSAEFRAFVSSLPAAKQMIRLFRPVMRNMYVAITHSRADTSSGSVGLRGSDGETKLGNIQLDEEWLALMSCETYLPMGKAKSILGYQPKIDFEEAMRRTGEFLHFAGVIEPDILRVSRGN